MNRIPMILLLAVIFAISIMYQTETMAPWVARSRNTSQKPGKWYNILTSFYGQNRADDNGRGAGEVDLFKFPYSRRINDTFGTRLIYPVAVPTKDVGYYKYAILEIKNGSKRIFAQVVDECADGDCADNIRAASKQNRKLVDIHATAFGAIGARDGLKKMKARIITREGVKRDAQMQSVLTSDGKRGYVTSHWK